MKKVFRCDATGESITVTEKVSGFSYDDVRNMTATNLAAILSYANENHLRDAIRFLAKERKERFINIAKLFHGRMYDIIKSL